MRALPLPQKLLLTVAAVAGSVALAWAGGILYWHWRLRDSIRALESSYSTQPGWRSPEETFELQERIDLLETAGCRSLPYLVEALNTPGNPQLQTKVMERIIDQLVGPGPGDQRTDDEYKRYSGRWDISEAASRAEKIADFNAWWRENRSRYHQGWRFWSACCAGD